MFNRFLKEFQVIMLALETLQKRILPNLPHPVPTSSIK
jgi:hypothetical protein